MFAVLKNKLQNLILSLKQVQNSRKSIPSISTKSSFPRHWYLLVLLKNDLMESQICKFVTPINFLTFQSNTLRAKSLEPQGSNA